jgi:hypothetical protein
MRWFLTNTDLLNVTTPEKGNLLWNLRNTYQKNMLALLPARQVTSSVMPWTLEHPQTVPGS